MKNTNKNNQVHAPVLLQEVLQVLNPLVGDKYLDLTAGYGGHALEVLKATKTEGEAVLVDRDSNAVEQLQRKFKEAQIVHSDFLSASVELQSQGKRFDLILADLGVSSPHLDNTSRGFSFGADAPLDMRMDQDQQLTADIIVNSYDENDLAEILAHYGEEPKARQIARAIVASRPIVGTAMLAEIAKKAWPKGSKTHPATRTFQAIRIAVNDELVQLENSINHWIELLNPDGRLAIISFHSLEDKIVKQAFTERSQNKYEATLKLLSKQPITASQREIVSNPRARSAKLRAAVKIKTK